MATSLVKLYGVFIDHVDAAVLQLVHRDDEPVIDPTGAHGGAFARLNVETGALCWHRAPREASAAAATFDRAQHAQIFDLVIDHRVRGWRAMPMRELRAVELARLRDVRALLRDGGVHARTLAHGPGAWSWLSRLRARNGGTDRVCALTPQSQTQLATAAGMRVCGSFYLYPSVSNPNLMVATSRRNAQQFFAGRVQVDRSRVSAFGYLARRLLVQLNLYRLLMDSVLVWAQK